MIVTVRDPSILSNLDPMQLTAYLQSRGWLQESRVDDKNRFGLFLLTMKNTMNLV